jgi:hypothetical protein
MKVQLALLAASGVIFALCTVANAKMAEAGARAAHRHPVSASGKALSKGGFMPVAAPDARGRVEPQPTSTKTRCAISKVGGIEDKVCTTVAIPDGEAMRYFAPNSNKAG